MLRRERSWHTLQPTALVSELFLKLHRFEAEIMEGAALRIAARAMKQVLIDHARARGSRRMTALETAGEIEARQSRVDIADSLAARLVFEKLRRFDARTADTIWLRCVEGFTIEQVSAAAKARSMARTGGLRFRAAMDG